MAARAARAQGSVRKRRGVGMGGQRIEMRAREQTGGREPLGVARGRGADEGRRELVIEGAGGRVTRAEGRGGEG